MLSAIRDAKAGNAAATERATARVGEGVNILLVDHEDSFVHTLANYFRQTGANVSTVRSPVAEEVFDRLKPDLVVLSPGPGTPKDFDCASTIKKARKRELPISASALACRRLPKPMAANCVSLPFRCMASRRAYASRNRASSSRACPRK
jgi:anthranilate synthase